MTITTRYGLKKLNGGVSLNINPRFKLQLLLFAIRNKELLIISSGYRDKNKLMEYYLSLPPVGERGITKKQPNGNPIADPEKSKHSKGLAVDIVYRDSIHKEKLIKALENQGSINKLFFIVESTCIHLEFIK